LTASNEQVLCGEDFEEITITFINQMDDEEIGRVALYRIPYELNPATMRLVNDYNMHIAMDDLSSDLSAASCALQSSDAADAIHLRLMSNDLYYVSSVYVEKQYRNMGIGRHILRHLQKIIRRHTRDKDPVIVLIPSPVEYKTNSAEYNEMKPRLVAWYERNGFNALGSGLEAMIFDN
jgi:ribosomal protein S18 acetylase RimI-like enzyme